MSRRTDGSDEAHVQADTEVDVLIVGSGMGGSAAAWALRSSGASVLVVERGRRLPREAENWSPEEVFVRGRYRTSEPWVDDAGRHFQPGVFNYVGGNTKLYGAMLPRLREADFGVVEHREGQSPAWPLTYADLEPFYVAAEQVLGVHGGDGDPTDPWRSAPYPRPALVHEPEVARLAERLSGQGLHPFSMPAGVDLEPGGLCIRCRTCDGFPCKLGAKSDAEVRLLDPALAAGVRLSTSTQVLRLVRDAAGIRLVGADVRTPSGDFRINAGAVLLAGGAVNSAALLLASEEGGLANSSGLVGRNYMVHNSTFFVAIDPRRKNRTRFQKTLAWNDWYAAGPSTPHPLGNVQMLGKLQGAMVAAARPRIPRSWLDAAMRRSVDLYLTSEDLPSPENRVRLDPKGRIQISWMPNNLAAHEELVRRTTSAMRRAGYPVILTQRMGIETNSHQCGTLVMGEDPATSVVDPFGRSHDVENLWVVDSSVFASSAAVNPALTIAALSLRSVSHSLLHGGQGG